MNIVDPILMHACLYPDAPAICAPAPNRESTTYGQLRNMANNVANMATTFGLASRSIVGLVIADPVRHLGITLGMLQAGIATIALRTTSAPKALNVEAVISDRPVPSLDGLRAIVLDETWFMGNASPPPADLSRQVRTDDLCRIVLTSGSTGNPRAVGFTHRSLILRNACFEYAYGHRLPRARRLYCDLGLGTSLAFMHIMYTLMRGGMVLLHDRDEMNTLLALNLYGIDHMLTSPYGLGEHLKTYEALDKLHCHLDFIMVAGGQLPSDLVMRACAVLSPHILNAYGSTEVGRVATGDARAMLKVHGAMGHVLPGADIEVVDDSDQPLPKGQEGILRMRRAEMADGYIGDSAASAEAFRSGWFYPGDLGRLADDDILVVTGRIGTRINIGGNKIDPEALETALVACTGVADAAVFATPNAIGIDEIHALVVPSDQFEEQRLRAHCEQTMDRTFVPSRFIQINHIPRNEMGKIDRPNLQALATIGRSTAKPS